MKRKKINETSSNLVKKKSTMNSNSSSGEKTLLDFWKPVRAKANDAKTLRSKSRSVAEEIEDIEVKPSKTYNLIQNPSKQLMSGNFQSNNYLDYKNRILFNEDFIGNLKTILEPFFENNKNNLLNHNSSVEEILDKEIYEEYIIDNIENILIKFLLQIDDNFLFVPKSYMNKNEKADKTKLKLIEGFNDSKYLSLQYEPTSLKEMLNDNLSTAITSYLKHFNKKIRKKGVNSNRKAFVIHDTDYIKQIKTVESICNELDYKIIRIDELEPQKNSQLNKISEATQSMRLSCLSERLSEKLKILERIINNDQMKFNYLCKNVSEEPTESIQSSFATAASKNSEIITHYFSHDTKERTVYNNIQDNIYQICAKKKTLILIVDSFSNSEEDKTYLNGIINKIAQTKCPIVILTNNFDFAKNDNLFNNSIKTISNHFTFYKTHSYDKKTKSRSLFLINIIIFLHLIVKSKLNELLGDTDISNGSNVDKIKFLTEQIKSLFDLEYLENIINEGLFSRISDLSLKISLLFEFDCDKIFYFLSNSDRFSKNIDPVEKTNLLYEQLSNGGYILEVIQNDNGSNDIKQYLKELEENSFSDFVSTNINKISNDKFNQFYYNIKYSNSKISKNFSLSKKEQESSINKNNEQLINSENLITKSAFNILSNHESEFSESKISVKNFQDVLSTNLQILKQEDKLFFKTCLINKIADVNRRNLHEYNYLLKKINEFDYETFISLFGIRKPRSTRKNIKDELTDDNRLNGFTKIFTKAINLPLLERYFFCHSINSNFYLINNELYNNQIELNYFTGYKIYEELKNNEQKDPKESSGDDYSSFESEDEFY